jgi:hypothetical protein
MFSRLRAYLINHWDNYLCKITEAFYLHLGEVVGDSQERDEENM